ncbi:MAG: hypothetical protein ABIR24_04545 [Verrucomicrobiota bacterium]
MKSVECLKCGAKLPATFDACPECGCRTGSRYEGLRSLVDILLLLELLGIIFWAIDVSYFEIFRHAPWNPVYLVAVTLAASVGCILQRCLIHAFLDIADAVRNK